MRFGVFGSFGFVFGVIILSAAAVNSNQALSEEGLVPSDGARIDVRLTWKRCEMNLRPYGPLDLLKRQTIHGYIIEGTRIHELQTWAKMGGQTISDQKIPILNVGTSSSRFRVSVRREQNGIFLENDVQIPRDFFHGLCIRKECPFGEDDLAARLDLLKANAQPVRLAGDRAQNFGFPSESWDESFTKDPMVSDLLSTLIFKIMVELGYALSDSIVSGTNDTHSQSFVAVPVGRHFFQGSPWAQIRLNRQRLMVVTGDQFLTFRFHLEPDGTGL